MLQDTEFKKANKDELRAVFKYLEFCLQQVVKDNELGALQQVCFTYLSAAVCFADQYLIMSCHAVVCDMLLDLNFVMLRYALFKAGRFELCHAVLFSVAGFRRQVCRARARRRPHQEPSCASYWQEHPCARPPEYSHSSCPQVC